MVHAPELQACSGWVRKSEEGGYHTRYRHPYKDCLAEI
jgi:hypothetical protein